MKLIIGCFACIIASGCGNTESDDDGKKEKRGLRTPAHYYAYSNISLEEAFDDSERIETVAAICKNGLFFEWRKFEKLRSCLDYAVKQKSPERPYNIMCTSTRKTYGQCEVDKISAKKDNNE